MKNDNQFVFDTNVLVSAVLLKQSISRKAFDHALEEGVILISESTIAELNDVLRREKFNKYITEEERIQFLTALVREAQFTDVTVEVTECRDPKDNKFLELAISGRANCIVSGDKDLSVLHPFRGISILSPREFLNKIWSQ